ncbi:hypothetical protein PIB30_012164 [Stylosanthes scabra]|uniref:Uncharacterized protein n=1 Tax=Stylosanthes scabra TaxID=79078 RepID=A0ABU6T5T1_9FABA|nr:hypothetical protein [Stylosanthes scabra]
MLVTNGANTFFFPSLPTSINRQLVPHLPLPFPSNISKQVPPLSLSPSPNPDVATVMTSFLRFVPPPLDLQPSQCRRRFSTTLEFRDDVDDLNHGNFFQIRDTINRLLDTLGPLAKPSFPANEIDDGNAMGVDDEDAYGAKLADAEHDDTRHPSPT